MNFSWVVEGKLAGSQGPRSRRDLEFLKAQGLLALVRMEPGSFAERLHVEITDLGIVDCYEPVPDMTAPTPGQVGRMVSFIRESIAEGKPTGVTCTAGLGRTGAILACYLVSTGLSAESAIRRVRRLRPGSIETAEQEEAVRAYHRAVQKPTKA